MSTSTTLPQALQASLNQARANITLAHREVPEGVVSTMVTHFLDGFFQSQSATSSGPAQIYSDGLLTTRIAALWAPIPPGALRCGKSCTLAAHG
jgi:hypothetical protein